MVHERKPLHWEASSKKDFKRFPISAQKDMGVALFVVQLGGTPRSAKPWKGLGSGVYELVGGQPGRHLSRGVLGAGWRVGACVARIPKEVEVRYCYAAFGRGFGRETVKSRICSLRGGWRDCMSSKTGFQGTDNVLSDLGFDDADELSAKAALALKLNRLIDQRALSQKGVAELTGMSQPKVSGVRRYKLQNISLERLMQALVSLDQDVKIMVQPTRRKHAAAITVTGIRAGVF